MRVLILIFFLPFLFPVAVLAQTLNAGLVSGIWYSRVPFFAGETVRIYTAVQNNSGLDITGKVKFLKNEELIGEMPFSAIKGGLIQVWADWKTEEGNHKVSARIVDANPPTLTSFAIAQDNVVVEKDTDHDRIGNAQDTDDDNDGLTDEKEKILGTDPLNKDTDGDGITDNQDVIAKEPTVSKSNFLAQAQEKTDVVVGSLVQQLKEQKKKVEQRIEKGENQKPVVYLPNIPEDRIPSKDDLTHFFLAAAVNVLLQWRTALFIIGGVVVWKLLRRFLFH